MRLKKLLTNLSKVPNPEIKGINTDSNLIARGELFVAIKGAEQDGHKFIELAIKNGAVAIVKQKSYHLQKSFIIKKAVIINVDDTRKVLSEVAAKFYNRPSEKLEVIGVTGTNGKTTVTYLVESILKEAGCSSGLIGTINYKFKNLVLPSINTTPGPLEIQAFLSKMVKEKLDYCVMETSSHSLAQDRVRDVNFRSAVFTNLTQDHLDYHKNINDYFLSKAKLFKNLSPKSWAIINNDDRHGPRLCKLTKAKILRFGFNNGSQIKASNLKLNINGSEFQVKTPRGNLRISTRLIGRHNVYNILAAIAVGYAEGLKLDVIKKGIQKLDYISGRLESIKQGQKFNLFVDYAHTDDALWNVLSSIKEFNRGKIIVVFGSGGQRDVSKRPKMGRVVSKLADYFILTNDNPRNENPSKIIKDISRGIKSKKYDVILDRHRAIEKAIKLAHDNDTVLIAGKGHEACQIFKNKILPFDDREEARKILRCLK